MTRDYFDYMFDRQEERWAIEDAPYLQRAQASRCDRCGYLLTASGHRVSCDGDK